MSREANTVQRRALRTCPRPDCGAEFLSIRAVNVHLAEVHCGGRPPGLVNDDLPEQPFDDGEVGGPP
ncbi:MAG: hypothetical protein KGK07_15235 [Chloroflexota bacterium]|nr:hypothetical protein [Chloroflexota bacterium]